MTAKITPELENSVSVTVNMGRNDSWFTVTEFYSSGFVTVHDTRQLDSEVVVGDDDLPTEYANSTGFEIYFSDDITADERETIRELYSVHGVAWLQSVDCTWDWEDHFVSVDAPYHIEWN